MHILCPRGFEWDTCIGDIWAQTVNSDASKWDRCGFNAICDLVTGIQEFGVGLLYSQAFTHSLSMQFSVWKSGFSWCPSYNVQWDTEVNHQVVRRTVSSSWAGADLHLSAAWPILPWAPGRATASLEQASPPLPTLCSVTSALPTSPRICSLLPDCYACIITLWAA